MRVELISSISGSSIETNLVLISPEALFNDDLHTDDVKNPEQSIVTQIAERTNTHNVRLFLIR